MKRQNTGRASGTATPTLYVGDQQQQQLRPPPGAGMMPMPAVDMSALPLDELEALRRAAAAAVAVSAGEGISPASASASSAASPALVPGGPGAAATASAAAHSAMAVQARSNAFAAHAQAQAQQNSQRHGIAALVAAIQTGQLPAGTLASLAAAAHHGGAPAAAAAAAAAASAAAAVAVASSGGGPAGGLPSPGILSSSGVGHVSLTAPASYPSPRSSLGSPAASTPQLSSRPGRTSSLSSSIMSHARAGLAAAGMAEGGTPNAGEGDGGDALGSGRSGTSSSAAAARSGPRNETAELLGALSSTDTTNAALGLQRLYESAETLSMLKRNSVDSPGGGGGSSRGRPQSRADSIGSVGKHRLSSISAERSSARHESSGEAGAMNGPAISKREQTDDAPVSLGEVGRSKSGPAALPRYRQGESSGNKADELNGNGTPLRNGRMSPVGRDAEPLVRPGSAQGYNAKSRALSLLPDKEQAEHLVQLYLDELGVVIPFVRPDFVMKELELLYSSLEPKSSKLQSYNSIVGTPRPEPRSADAADQSAAEPSAANVVNPIVGTGPGAGLPHPRYTFLAYVLFALSSIAELLPPEYLVNYYDETRRSDRISVSVQEWQEAAIGCIDAAEIAANPSLEGIQASLVAIITLAHRFRHKDLLRFLDSATRAARRLGLDRLGSADASVCPGPHPSMKIELSKRTLQHWWLDPEEGMSSANLEIGRAVWSGILMADWNHCGLNGSYNIYPGSYTTRPPIAPAQPEFCQVGMPSVSRSDRRQFQSISSDLAELTPSPSRMTLGLVCWRCRKSRGERTTLPDRTSFSAPSLTSPPSSRLTRTSVRRSGGVRGPTKIKI